MGDFLTNLARRSVSGGNGLRPRLTSLFEPASAVPGAFNDPGESNSRVALTNFADAEAETTGSGEEPEQSSTAVFPARRRSGKRPSVQATQASAEDNLTFDDTGEAGPEPQRSTPARAQRRLSSTRSNLTIDAIRFEEAALPVAVLESKPSVSMPSRTGSSIPAPAPAMFRRDDLAIEDDRPAPAAPGTLLAGPLPAGGRPDRHADENVAPAFPDVANRSSVARPVLVPNVVHARKRSNRTFEQAQAEHEPTIQVTIGRVEVRAEVGSQATTRAERTSSPVMSLEEYLRRRALRGVE